jgi:hypothetical protein
MDWSVAVASDDTAQRRAIAENSEQPWVLAVLTRDADPDTRQLAALNSACPPQWAELVRVDVADLDLLAESTRPHTDVPSSSPRGLASAVPMSLSPASAIPPHHDQVSCPPPKSHGTIRRSG